MKKWVFIGIAAIIVAAIFYRRSRGKSVFDPPKEPTYNPPGESNANAVNQWALNMAEYYTREPIKKDGEVWTWQSRGGVDLDALHDLRRLFGWHLACVIVAHILKEQGNGKGIGGNRWGIHYTQSGIVGKWATSSTYLDQGAPLAYTDSGTKGLKMYLDLLTRGQRYVRQYIPQLAWAAYTSGNPIYAQLLLIAIARAGWHANRVDYARSLLHCFEKVHQAAQRTPPDPVSNVEDLVQMSDEEWAKYLQSKGVKI